MSTKSVTSRKLNHHKIIHWLNKPSSISGRIIIFLTLVIIAEIFLNENVCWAQSKIKKHAILYGGISDLELVTIAKTFDILIIGQVKNYQLKRIKQINPGIILLKYQHSIGMNPVYADWKKVNKNEDWFAHDRITGKRIIQIKYKWYLMNINNYEWQKHWVHKIIDTTQDIYDGVFLDDFWETWVDKFHLADSEAEGTPDENLILSWNSDMVTIIKKLRDSYKGLIFINGISESYMPYFDGCMYESFIHSTWNPDDFYHNSSSFERTIIKIDNLLKWNKTILLNSGTKGDTTKPASELFKYCYASYLLISNEKTSFYFQPSQNRKGIPLYSEYVLDLGEPLSTYSIYEVKKINNNLIDNGDFHMGLQGWDVLEGNPVVEKVDSRNGNVVKFLVKDGVADKISSDFIPVTGNIKLKIAAYCRSDGNIPGSKGYYKLGIKGRFYDKAYKRIDGTLDLQFEEGKYGWMPFENTAVSPTNAAYYKIVEMGFIGDGHGAGWISDVYFGSGTKEKYFQRNFTNGVVLVNPVEKIIQIEVPDKNDNGKK